MIDFIVQIEGQNLLQVHYTSGYNRFIRPDDWGNYKSNMTKTQRRYIEKSVMYEMKNADGWGTVHYYYLLDGRPIINRIKNHNKGEV